MGGRGRERLCGGSVSALEGGLGQHSLVANPPVLVCVHRPPVCSCARCTRRGPGRRCSGGWVAGPVRSSVLLASWCWRVHSEVVEGAAPDFEGVNGCSFCSHGCCSWPSAGDQSTHTRATSS